MAKKAISKVSEPKSTASASLSFPIVAIGASSGGLVAMRELLKYLPATTGMAFIYVQHLSPTHKSLLSSILGKVTKMKVQEVDQMELIKPNHIYVIPPDRGIEVTDGHIKIVQRTKGVSAISIDVLFSSLAETHRNQVIGIILSGNARDGQNGLGAIKAAGGVTFAQDNSAQASSMPESAIAAGAVDYVMSPKNIALELGVLSKNKFQEFKKRVKRNLIDYSRPDLSKLFDYLKEDRGLDFNSYKLPTIKRRLKQRMAKCNINTIEAYLSHLKKDKNEIDDLYNSLLINVTGFFRDAAAFRYLKAHTFPLLVKAKKEGDEIRIWVPACSTGPEAYSLAILINEVLKKTKRKVQVKIFATDVSEHAVQQSRMAEYKKSELKAGSKSYLQKYFIKKGESYQIVKELRDMCVFAVHNILRDPPFSKMDFITCRNMLIYFEPIAQKQVFNSLYFALKEDGFLMLGKVETVGTSSLLFNSVNKTYKIFSKKKNLTSKRSFDLAPLFKTKGTSVEKTIVSVKNKSTTAQSVESVIDQVLLAEYAPACVLINQEMEIIQSKGSISSFLKLANGKASLNILKMTRPEFGFELRSLIFKAIKTKKNNSKKVSKLR
jgi:two-component system CheB/CheR fusion protein